MSTEELSKTEISRRITVGMGLVYDLFNEVVPLLGLIRECVESNVDAVCLNGTSFRIRLENKRTPADALMNTDLGLAFELDRSPADEDEDFEEDDPTDSPNKSSGMRVASGSRFMMFRAQLYERIRSHDDSFVPSIFGVILSDLKRTDRRKKSSETKADFGIAHGAFLKIVRSFDGSMKPGSEVTSKISGGSLSGTVEAVCIRPLADFDTEDSIADFVNQILVSAKQDTEMQAEN